MAPRFRLQKCRIGRTPGKFPGVGFGMSRDTQIVGNVGMFYAAYQLSRLSWNVMPTARNARGIDLLAYDTNADRYLGIQIKTLSERTSVPLGNSLAKLMGDWWIVVTKAVTGSPVSYILTPAEVRSLAARNEKDGRVSYWLEPSRHIAPEYREAWHRIGRGDACLTAAA